MDNKQLGPYILNGLLGRGAMACVWRAWDSSLQRYIALKEPLFDPRYSAEVLEEVGRRFVREAQVGARLRGHPGIVAVYEADVYDGRPAVAMELVEGATLGEILSSGPLDVATTLDVLDQLLDAVGYAHSLGIVHRDLKPDNIFVDTTGHVKVADFGIASVNDSSYAKATMVSVVLGTPGYMSPEQALGSPADARSDLFSIGVLAYEMLCDRNPFGASDGVDSTQLLYNIVHEPAPPLPKSIADALPEGLEGAIMSAMSKRPDDRPRDAEAFRTTLREIGQRAAVNTHAAAIRVPNNAVAGAPFGAGVGAAAGAAASAATSRVTNYAPAGAGVAAVVAPIEGGTLTMPASAAVQPPSQKDAAVRWVPIAAITAVCVILLLGLLITAQSPVGGGVGGVAGAPAATKGSVATESAESAVASSASAKGDKGSTSQSSAATPEPEGNASEPPSAPEPTQEQAVAAASPEPDPTQEPAIAPEEPIAEDYPEADGDSYYYDDYAPAGSFWGVFIDSFYDMDSAYACADDASASGLPSTVYEIADGDTTYYVVSAGEFSTRSEAEAVLSQALALGYSNAYTSTATHL